MDLEDSMLGEINQRKTNVVCSHFYVKTNKQKNSSSKIQGTTDWWLPEVEGGWEVGKLGDGGPKNRLIAIK